MKESSHDRRDRKSEEGSNFRRTNKSLFLTSRSNFIFGLTFANFCQTLADVRQLFAALREYRLLTAWNFAISLETLNNASVGFKTCFAKFIEVFDHIIVILKENTVEVCTINIICTTIISSQPTSLQ